MLGNERTESRQFQVSLDDLPRALAFVREFAQKAGLSRNDVLGLELAVDEALTNIIRYAFTTIEGNYEIILTEDYRGVYIELIDDGIPFDPTRVPVTCKSAEELDGSNGFGLLLINHFTDATQYHRDGDSKNHFTLIRLKAY